MDQSHAVAGLAKNSAPPLKGTDRLFGSGQRGDPGDIDFKGGVPSVIDTLHPDPNQRRIPEQLGEAHGNLGADG